MSPLMAYIKDTTTRVVKNNIKEYSTKVCPLTPPLLIEFTAACHDRDTHPPRYCHSHAELKKAPFALINLAMLLSIALVLSACHANLPVGVPRSLKRPAGRRRQPGWPGNYMTNRAIYAAFGGRLQLLAEAPAAARFY